MSAAGASGNQLWSKETERGQQPPAWNGSHEHRAGAIHAARCLQITSECLVLVLVPVLRVQLSEPGALAHHRLHQIVRHLQTLAAPCFETAQKNDPGRHCQRKPRQQRDRKPSNQQRRDREIKHREQACDSPAQGQTLQRFRLQRLPKETTDSTLAHFVRRQLQRALQDSPLELAAQQNGDHALQPGRHRAAWDRGGEQQRPSHQPPLLHPAGERKPAQQDPCDQPEAVLQ